MSYVLPSQLVHRLNLIVGRRLIRVVRWLFEEDEHLPDFEQDADGPTTLHFESGFSLHVRPDTARQGIELSTSEDPVYGDSYRFTDVSQNRFWQERIPFRVKGISILKAHSGTHEYPAEFGLELLFENDRVATLEYVDTLESPDMLRVRGRFPEDTVMRLPIGSSAVN